MFVRSQETLWSSRMKSTRTRVCQVLVHEAGSSCRRRSWAGDSQDRSCRESWAMGAAKKRGPRKGGRAGKKRREDREGRGPGAGRGVCIRLHDRDHSTS